MVLRQVIKAYLGPASDSIGRNLDAIGITPGTLTGLGLGLALAAGLLFAAEPSRPYLAAFAILGSGGMDLLDGSVARAAGQPNSNSLNDSLADRLSEIAIYCGIIYAGYGVSPTIVLLALAFSLLPSYVLAKGMSQGVTIQGLGVAERAERMSVLVVFAIAGFVWVAVYANLILAAVTFLQRYIHIRRASILC